MGVGSTIVPSPRIVPPPAATSAQEALLIRQSLAVNANLQAVANAYCIDREAQAHAALELVAQETDVEGLCS
jgi:hypothetical protein